VALRHRAFNVWVFGSVARGVVDESSDIDLLVDYNGIRIKPFD
jgi:predicted nucleotidyltransferase